MAKDKFIIEPHFRLQEWVAEEKGYFKDEGLDYEFQELIKSTDGAHHYKGDKVGAMQTFEKGRSSDVSCACHWTVSVAASKGTRQALCRRLFGGAVRRLRAAGLAGEDAGRSRRRADLGRLPVGQPLLDHPGARAVHAGGQDQSDRSPTACCSTAWSSCSTARRRPARCSAGPTTSPSSSASARSSTRTFMIATMLTGDPDPEDVRKFFRALRRAQRDIDLRPELYTHYYKNEFPERFHATDGHAPLGSGRAHRVRALHQGGLRGDLQVDRRARHLRRHRHGLGQVRGRRHQRGELSPTAIHECDAAGPRRRRHRFRRKFRSGEPTRRIGSTRSEVARRSGRGHAQPDQPVERRVILQQLRRARAVHDAAALEHDRMRRSATARSRRAARPG